MDADSLTANGFADVAVRLQYLHDVTEPDEEAIKPDSVSSFAKFIMANRDLQRPQITVTVDGFIQAVWRQPQGTLIMNFRDSGDVSFTLLGKGGPETMRRKVSGKLSPDQTMRVIECSGLWEW